MAPTIFGLVFGGLELYNQSIPKDPKKTRQKIWRNGYIRSGSKNPNERKRPTPSRPDSKIPLRRAKFPNQAGFLIHEQNPNTDSNNNRDEPRVFSNNVMRESLSYPVGVEITGYGYTGNEITGYGYPGHKITGYGIPGLRLPVMKYPG